APAREFWRAVGEGVLAGLHAPRPDPARRTADDQQRRIRTELQPGNVRIGVALLSPPRLFHDRERAHERSPRQSTDANSLVSSSPWARSSQRSASGPFATKASTCSRSVGDGLRPKATRNRASIFSAGAFAPWTAGRVSMRRAAVRANGPFIRYRA